METPKFALLEMVDAYCMNEIMRQLDFTKAMVSIYTIEPNLFVIAAYGIIPDCWVYEDDDFSNHDIWCDDKRYIELKQKYEERFSE